MDIGVRETLKLLKLIIKNKVIKSANYYHMYCLKGLVFEP